MLKINRPIILFLHRNRQCQLSKQVLSCSREKSSDHTIKNTSAASKAVTIAPKRTMSHGGKGWETSLFVEECFGLDGALPVKRPQEGQPFLKSASSPTNLQKGQRTAEKCLPQPGQVFSS